MVAVASWWFVLQVLGLVALPIALRLFRHLPDRGYAFAKPLGLLLTGYLLWIGASFGFLSNTRTAMWFAMLLVGLVSAWLWRRDGEEMASSLRENWRAILATEIVFAVFFVGWAFVRAHNPAIDSTEKPMEIAFLNAILGSEGFPPYDPWMSGFGISYYYMGYLLVAVLTRLSGVIPTVGFNLAISSLFALTATGSFSLVYNLWALDQRERWRERLSGIAWALLGPLFVVVIGNLEGLFEVLHSRGLGSRAFWEWMDLHGLQNVPVSGRWIPSDNWWWWRASRVVNDKNLSGLHMEVIDEFPQFSFLLGDMHPHVLDLPFVLLAIALALNIVLGARSWVGDTETGSGLRALPAAVWQLLRGMWQDHGFEMLMFAFCLGSLGFINTWDLPIYLVVVHQHLGPADLSGRRDRGVSHRAAHAAASRLAALHCGICFVGGGARCTAVLAVLSHIPVAGGRGAAFAVQLYARPAVSSDVWVVRVCDRQPGRGAAGESVQAGWRSSRVLAGLAQRLDVAGGGSGLADGARCGDGRGHPLGEAVSAGAAC